METKHGNMIARDLENGIEAGNSRIVLKVIRHDGGYAQEFYAIDRRGLSHLLLTSLHKNLIPSSEHRACSSPMIAGERAHLFGVCRESLRMVYSHVEIAHHDERKVQLLLTGVAQGHTLSCRITIEDESNTAHVLVEDEIERNGSDPLIEYVMSSYAFLPAEQAVLEGRELDYAWAPNLRPANDHVIGDQSFHSPAVIVQEGRLMAALVPDLRVLSKNRVMPAALDLDLSNGLLPAPLLSYGFCGYEETADGDYHSHDITMARRLSGAHLTYGYDLILEADCKRSAAHSWAARHLWSIYGAPEARHSRDHSAPASPILQLSLTRGRRSVCVRQKAMRQPTVKSTPRTP